MDSFKEVTHRGYGQNIGNSIKGIFIGLLLLIGSIILLWWNEGRSVDQATALQEMKENITTLPSATYDAQYDGKAVLVQGKVEPLHEVVDAEFGVRTDGLILKKDVQMYQWRENKQSRSEDKLGGGTETVTTYDYVKTWSATQIDSSFFKHQSGHENPVMSRKSETYVTEATLGAFHLDKNMVRYIEPSKRYHGLNEMPEQIGVARNHKSFLYIGERPEAPEIGDVKISYTYAPSGVYSYAAKVAGKSLAPYITENGKSFVFVRTGNVDAMTIFQEELDANTALTWMLRGVGLLLMFIGFSMMMGPIVALLKVIPAIGSFAGGVTGIIAGVLTLLLGSVVIALAWFGSRPLLSLGILGVGTAIAVGMAKFGKRSDATSQNPPPRTQTQDNESEEAGQSTVTPPPRKL